MFRIVLSQRATACDPGRSRIGSIPAGRNKACSPLSRAFDTPLSSKGSLLPGQDLRLLEQRVFQGRSLSIVGRKNSESSCTATYKSMRRYTRRDDSAGSSGIRKRQGRTATRSQVHGHSELAASCLLSDDSRG